MGDNFVLGNIIAFYFVKSMNYLKRYGNLNYNMI